jgi:hypothetical protein
MRKTGNVTLELTERPYTVPQLEKMIARVRDLQGAHFPTSKLQLLYESIVDKSMVQSMFTWAFVAGRAKKHQLPKLIEFFQPLDDALLLPWRGCAGARREPSSDTVRCRTPMVDVAELYEFLRVRKDGR